MELTLMSGWNVPLLKKKYRNLYSESLENDSSSIREEGTSLPPAEQ